MIPFLSTILHYFFMQRVLKICFLDNYKQYTIFHYRNSKKTLTGPIFKSRMQRKLQNSQHEFYSTKRHTNTHPSNWFSL